MNNSTPNKQALILGATSAIATAVSQQLQSAGFSLCLVGRNATKLKAISDDLIAKKTDQQNVTSHCLDFNDPDATSTLFQKLKTELPSIDITLIAHGILPDEAQCKTDEATLNHMIDTNFTSQLKLLNKVAERYKEQGQGNITVISSVAGDRGRKSNYVYGSTKAAINTYCSGLRAELTAHNVNLLVVKPGFVDTPMTQHIQPKGALWTSPEKVASDIIKAIKKKKSTLYTPFFWKYIMLIIRNIPEKIFNKLNF